MRTAQFTRIVPASTHFGPFSPGRAPAARRRGAIGLALLLAAFAAALPTAAKAQTADDAAVSGPSALTGPQTWNDSFLVYLKLIYGILGGGIFPPNTTAQQAMRMVENQYAAFGIPRNLDPQLQLTLTDAVLNAELLVLVAPPDIDSRETAAFQRTLESMYNDLVPLYTTSDPAQPY